MAAMGHIIQAASSTKSSGSSFLPILLILVVMGAIYFTMSRRSRARQAAQMTTNLVPGQPVRTTSGMYGTISSVEGDDVMVEVHPGVHVRMMKRAVVPVAGDGPSMNGSGPTTDAHSEDEDPADSVSDEADDAEDVEDADERADEASADDLSPKKDQKL
jgi:preprotein translocase subunit YajC